MTHIPDNVRQLMPKMQQDIIQRSNEFDDVISALQAVIENIPLSHETEDVIESYPLALLLREQRLVHS